MTTATPSLPVSSKVLPMTLGLGALAAAAVPFLGAVGMALGFRSGGAPDAMAPMWVAAAACLVGLPWVWATVSRKDRAWTMAAVFAIVSGVLAMLAREIYPRISEGEGSVLMVGFGVAFAIMLAAGWLAIFIRSAWKKRNWLNFGLLVAGYVTVAAAGSVFSAVVLFAE